MASPILGGGRAAQLGDARAPRLAQMSNHRDDWMTKVAGTKEKLGSDNCVYLDVEMLLFCGLGRSPEESTQVQVVELACTLNLSELLS
jgi:hypothetical protein